MILINQISFLSYTPIGHLEINFLICNSSKTILFVPMRGGIANAMRASGRHYCGDEPGLRVSNFFEHEPRRS